MNLRYLEILEAVAQTGSFTGAAKKLHLTQSAISHAMAELEQQAGTPLFDRQPRGVSLTQCGAALLEEAKGILASCRSLERRIAHLEEDTPVDLVSSITVATFLLPRIIKDIQKRMPKQQIRVRVASAARAVEILQNGEADLAFVEGAKPRGAFAVERLGSYRLLAVCAPSFLPEDKTLSVQELCGYPLLLREPGSAVRDTFDGMLSLANQKADPLWESVNSQVLMRAAEAGLGITVLPDVLLADALTSGRLRPVQIEGLEMENGVQVVRRRDKYMTHSLQVLMEVLSQEAHRYF